MKTKPAFTPTPTTKRVAERFGFGSLPDDGEAAMFSTVGELRDLLNGLPNEATVSLATLAGKYRIDALAAFFTLPESSMVSWAVPSEDQAAVTHVALCEINYPLDPIGEGDSLSRGLPIAGLVDVETEEADEVESSHPLIVHGDIAAVTERISDIAAGIGCTTVCNLDAVESNMGDAAFEWAAEYVASVDRPVIFTSRSPWTRDEHPLPKNYEFVELQDAIQWAGIRIPGGWRADLSGGLFRLTTPTGERFDLIADEDKAVVEHALIQGLKTLDATASCEWADA